jgi:hypothetical protein
MILWDSSRFKVQGSRFMVQGSISNEIFGIMGERE